MTDELKNITKKHGYRNKGRTIYQSLITYFILIAILPTIISASVCLVITNIFRQETDRTLGNEIITHVTSELDYIFKSMMTAGDYIADNYTLQKALRIDFHGDEIAKGVKEIEVDTEVFTSNLLDSDIAGISVVGENGSEFKSHAQAFLEQKHKNQIWYRTIIQSDGYVWFSSHNGRFANVSDGRSYITCGRSIYDKSTGKVLGVLLIDIEESVLQSNLEFSYGTDGYMMVVNSIGDVVCSSNGMKGRVFNYVELTENSDGEQTTLSITAPDGSKQNVNAFASLRKLETTNWNVVGVISSNALSTWWRTLLIVEFAVVGMIIFFAIFFAFKASERIVNPINNLQETMSYVESGNLDISIDNDAYYDEINALAGQFNMMVSRIKSLLQDVYNKQQKLRTAELTALQFQINPHFLYNTFDSVLWLNRAGRVDDVEKMVASLSTFFRIGVSKGESVIPIRDEIRHLKSYLDIQRIRYRDRIRYKVDVPEEVLDCRIPKLTLQPLAENAIYHGIDMNDQEGEISVRMERIGESIIITISDTGMGMPQEQVETLNRILKGEKIENAKIGYGIKNVHDRLEIIYEGRVSMYYESEEEEGTSVNIIIPYDKNEEE